MKNFLVFIKLNLHSLYVNLLDSMISMRRIKGISCLEKEYTTPNLLFKMYYRNVFATISIKKG